MASLTSIKRLIESFQRSCERHSLAVNVTVTVLLLVLCSASYTFLLTLYFSKGMWTRSFIYVNGGRLPPTTAIPLCGALLTGATSALLSRSGEHDLWAAIINNKPASHINNQLSPDEAHRQAQWTISPVARLAYVFRGQSWTLRFGGLLLFGTSVLNPVLLYGVSPGFDYNLRNLTHIPTESAFAGFAPSEARGLPDSSMITASLASMTGLIAPSANVCPNASCSAKAIATALHAQCVTSSQSFIDYPTFAESFPSDGAITRCSTFGNETCIAVNESTSANFTSGPSTACSNPSLWPHFECPAGDFAVIYGTWQSDLMTHTVDCRVSFGNVTISQFGQGPPSLDRESFIQSVTNIPFSSKDWAFGIPAASQEEENFSSPAAYNWQQLYLGFASSGEWGTYLASPYTFSISTGSDNLRSIGPLCQYLLVASENYAVLKKDPAEIAQAIEANFDMATLFAWAKAPRAASFDITHKARIDKWNYDARVLSILTFPFIATILVLSKRWSVYSNDIVIGYHPHLIAQRADEVFASSSRTENRSDKNRRPRYDGPRGDYAAISDRATEEISLTRMEIVTERRDSNQSDVQRRVSGASIAISETRSEETDHGEPGILSNPEPGQGSPVSLSAEQALPLHEPRLLN